MKRVSEISLTRHVRARAMRTHNIQYNNRMRNERKRARERKDVEHDNRQFIAVFATLGIRFSAGGSTCLKTRLYSRRSLVVIIELNRRDRGKQKTRTRGTNKTWHRALERPGDFSGRRFRHCAAIIIRDLFPTAFLIRLGCFSADMAFRKAGATTFGGVAPVLASGERIFQLARSCRTRAFAKSLSVIYFVR